MVCKTDGFGMMVLPSFSSWTSASTFMCSIYQVRTSDASASVRISASLFKLPAMNWLEMGAAGQSADCSKTTNSTGKLGNFASMVIMPNWPPPIIPTRIMVQRYALLATRNLLVAFFAIFSEVSL